MSFRLPAWFGGADRRSRWLVGVSGGADSVALLHLLVGAGFGNLVVCHVNHGLRGEESDLDEQFVIGLAESLGLCWVSEKVDVLERMRMLHESMETAARGLRHACFARWALRWGCADVLLAHQADEQAETILWNLLRGSHGLRGMREQQRIRVGEVELCVWRPLLTCRKAELIGWLEAGRHRWREDATNAEGGTIRNRVRHQVLPLMREVAGRDPVQALLRAAEDVAEQDALVDACLARVSLQDPQGRLHVPGLRQLNPLLQREALRRYLVQHGVAGISRRLLQEGVDLLVPGGAHVINLPGGRRLRRRQGRMWIE